MSDPGYVHLSPGLLAFSLHMKGVNDELDYESQIHQQAK